MARPKGVPPMTEAAWQRMVLRLAAWLGWDLRYHTRDSRGSAAGFPDLVLTRRRRVVFAELKSQAGRVRAEQAAWLAALREAGQEAYLWRPGDVEDVRQVLTREER